MPLSFIVMPYKENCKSEGEIMTKFKIAKMYFADKLKQNDIAEYLLCHKNTVNKIISDCKNKSPDDEIWKYLYNIESHVIKEKMESLFNFFKHNSRKPNSHKLSIQSGSDEEKLIIEKFNDKKFRNHNILTKINIQMDRGREFYSGSKRKQKDWNDYLKQYNAYVYDTEGAKWKQNLVERSHRIDDEEFYCPRGNKINSKTEFMLEAQFWIIYYNHWYCFLLYCVTLGSI